MMGRLHQHKSNHFWTSSQTTCTRVPPLKHRVDVFPPFFLLFIQLGKYPEFFIVLFILVYQKGDLVKQPMKSRDVLPKNFPGVG